MQGYRVAQDPTDWQSTKDEERIAADALYDEQQAQYALEVGDDAMDTAPEGGKKRKREEGASKKKESAADAKKRKKAEEPAAKKVSNSIQSSFGIELTIYPRMELLEPRN